MKHTALVLALALCPPAFGETASPMETGAVVKSDQASFFRNTIPQVARLGDSRLFAVWGAFGKNDLNGRIHGAFSSDGGKSWSKPRLLIDDPKFMDGDPNILVDGKQVWVYCTRVTIPNTIKKSWTMMVHSTDNGETWSAPVEIFIPRQYTPGKQHNALKLRDGSYAMGIAWDLWAEQGMTARTEGEMNLSTGILLSADGTAWTLHGNLHANIADKIRPGYTNGLCEPSIVQLGNGEILMLLRNASSHHYESRSQDGGVTWSDPVPSALTGSNTPVALWRNDKSATEIVAVWNSSPLNRWPLVTALSKDGGRTWSKPKILADPGRQVSYPGLTQTSDGTFVAVWQEALADGGRDIRFARYSREWLLGDR